MSELIKSSDQRLFTERKRVCSDAASAAGCTGYCPEGNLQCSQRRKSRQNESTFTFICLVPFDYVIMTKIYYKMIQHLYVLLPIAVFVTIIGFHYLSITAFMVKMSSGNWSIRYMLSSDFETRVILTRIIICRPCQPIYASISNLRFGCCLCPIPWSLSEWLLFFIYLKKFNSDPLEHEKFCNSAVQHDRDCNI